MSYLIFCFLLISFIGVFSEKKEVDLDSFVLLFDNVTAGNLEIDVSLYKNGAENPYLIVKWNIINGDITATWRLNNYKKIYMDGNTNIWIANIDKIYEGKYYIQSSQKREAEIVISGISHDTTSARNQKDETEGISHDTTSARNQKDETEGCSNTLIIAILVIVVVLVVLFVIAVVFIYPKYGRCHCKKNSEHKTEDTSTKHSTCTGLEEVRVLIEPLDDAIYSEHKTEHANNEPHTYADPEDVRELSEPHNESLCKICFTNIKSMVLVPCGHMTTCTKCSRSLQKCPVCGTEIENMVKAYAKVDSSDA